MTFFTDHMTLNWSHDFLRSWHFILIPMTIFTNHDFLMIRWPFLTDHMTFSYWSHDFLTDMYFPGHVTLVSIMWLLCFCLFFWLHTTWKGKLNLSHASKLHLYIYIYIYQGLNIPTSTQIKTPKPCTNIPETFIKRKLGVSFLKLNQFVMFYGFFS
jgi:hypothetical protein